MFTRKAPQINAYNPISKLTKIHLGQSEQWIYLRGVNKTHPILLLLHGGPGAAQIGFIRPYQQELEKQFVVVNWDQRGAGLSYSKTIAPETMTIRQLVNDTIELTQYLTARFHQEKIYLIGHSWGTILGLLAVQQAPELFKRYFGIAQVANYIKGEKLSYELVLKRAKVKGDKKSFSYLNEIGPPPWNNLKHDRIHQKLLGKYGGGVTHDRKFLLEIIKRLLVSKEYTFRDVIRLFRGQLFSMKELQEEMRELNLEQSVRTLAIPIYFCMGRHDLTVPPQSAETLFTSIQAPEKHWVWFENSAHSPHVEERDTFAKLIINETTKDK